jgi:DNA-directed RNA polymerase specialized sigma24 family protein
MIVPDLNNSQYRQRLMACDPQVLDEVSAYYFWHLVNWTYSFEQVRDDVAVIANDTMSQVWRTLLRRLATGSNSPKFDSQADFEAYIWTIARHKAIRRFNRLKKQREREVQLVTQEEEDDDEHADWGEKIAGGTSQAHRASQDALDEMLTSFCRQSAFDLLKKEDRDIISKVLGLDARGNVKEDTNPIDIKTYSQLVGKPFDTVKRHYHRAVNRWKKLL